MVTSNLLVVPEDFFVLLSCAEDTHAPFTGYLVRDLEEVEYPTILDRESDELEINVIEAASVSVVILSDQYLSCPSCLDKLADISEVAAGQLFLPILYDVKPPYVTHRIHAYRNSVDSQRFQRWAQATTKALTALSHFTPCHFQRDGDTFAYKCIEKIVQVISRHSATVQNPKERLVFRLLELGSSEDGVCVVGIGGDPGIGKIIARRVYNTIGGEGFDGYCFLDVEKNLNGPLSGHFKSMFFSGMVANNPGISSITKNTLNLMKVFVVFQGINDLNRWKYAVELINEFGSGSRVILISQDIALLQRVYEVERPHRITGRFVRVGDSTDIPASGHPLDGTPDDRSRNWDPMEFEYQLSSFFTRCFM